MTSPLIPQSYQEWVHCITVECGLQLDSQFIAARIGALSNEKSEHTRQFIQLYGRSHHTRILGWFRQAGQEEK